MSAPAVYVSLSSAASQGRIIKLATTSSCCSVRISPGGTLYNARHIIMLFLGLSPRGTSIMLATSLSWDAVPFRVSQGHINHARRVMG